MRSPEVDRTILTPHHNPQQQMAFFGFRLVESLRMAFYRTDNSVKANAIAFRGADLNRRPLGQSSHCCWQPLLDSQRTVKFQISLSSSPHLAPDSGRLRAFSCSGNDSES
jgi:hypothetical protein